MNIQNYEYYREARDLSREIQEHYEPECEIDVGFKPASATPMNWIARATKKCGCNVYAAGDDAVDALQYLLAYVTEEVDTASKHTC